MKQQVVYGHPWLYWRRFMLPGIMSFLAMVVPGFIILWAKLIKVDISEFVVVLMTLVFLQALGWVWLLVSLVRGHLLVKSYRASKGLRCLVCWYEMLPSQTQCPECGSPWARIVLKKPWKVSE